MHLKTFTLAVIILSKILAGPIVFIEFKLHQDRLAKEACVERQIPMTICRANCVLISKMKLATDTEEDDKGVKSEKSPEILYLIDFPDFQFFGIRTSCHPSTRHFCYCQGFGRGVEEPPEVCFSMT